MSLFTVLKKIAVRFAFTIICVLLFPLLLSGCTTVVQHAIIIMLPFDALLTDYIRFIYEIVTSENKPDNITQWSFSASKFKSSWRIFFKIGSKEALLESEIRAESLKTFTVNEKLVAKKSKKHRIVITILFCLLLGLLYGPLAPMIRESQFYGNIQIYTLGSYYYVEEDYKKFFQFLLPLAKQGNALAQHNLGVVYFEGRGIPKDYEKAVHWFQAAHKRGRIESTRTLATIYMSGEGVPKSCTKAIRLLEQAIEAKDTMSIALMGQMYFEGKCVKKDVYKGIALIKKASQMGNDEASFVLGICYEYGLGGIQDIRQAKNIYLDLAKKDFPKAQVSLARILFDLGGRDNDLEGFKWLNSAVELGEPDAIDLLKEIEMRSTNF